MCLHLPIDKSNIANLHVFLSNISGNKLPMIIVLVKQYVLISPVVFLFISTCFHDVNIFCTCVYCLLQTTL
jgi:hypothetical protein